MAETAIAIATISAIAAAPLPAAKAAPWRHPRSAHVTLPQMGYHGSPRGGEHKVKAAGARVARLARYPRSIRATERKASGVTRIAAPVGQARTQAGPPALPEHMSHLIASLGDSAPSALAAFLRHS